MVAAGYRGFAPDVPIVVLTYQKDEALALKAARAGAQDYLTKGEVTPELMQEAQLTPEKIEEACAELEEDCSNAQAMLMG